MIGLVERGSGGTITSQPHPDHLRYLRQQFQPAVDLAIFTEEEKALLLKRGCWLQALEAGKIPPTTPEQHQFLEVMAGNCDPIHPLQEVWLKYKRRVAHFEEIGGTPRYERFDERQQWYDDASYKRGIHFPRRHQR